TFSRGSRRRRPHEAPLVFKDPADRREYFRNYRKTARARPALTAERLRELLDYDPASGTMVWRVNRRGGAKAGSEAGSLNGQGYVLISAGGSSYMRSRLAWLYMTGAWPAAPAT